MATVVDARGLSCPQPVILAKKAVEAAKFPIEVMVDTVTARENVSRLATSAGCQVQVEQAGAEFKVTISK